jgi:hypothetical protein
MWLSTVLLILIVLVPLLQLLPLPEWLWRMPAARAALQRDLVDAGIGALQFHWTLAPAATERDLLALLPPAALFVSALTFGSEAQRRMFWLAIGLTFASLLLAVAQIDGGKDGFLNLYPQWEPAMGGVFANPNHQAAMVAVALVLTLALLLEVHAKASRSESTTALIRQGVLWALIAIFLLVTPMIGSRAGPVLAVVPTVLFVFGSGAVSFDVVRRNRILQGVVALAVGALGLGVYSALNWTTGEKVDTIRSMLAQQTLAIGNTQAPLGGGLGSFPEVFDQGIAPTLLRDEYINAAHNEYAQLWLETGIVGAIVALAVLAWLALSIRRLLGISTRSNSRRRGLAAATAMLVLILHSWVDYPLRTPALLAMFGLMAGIVATVVEKAARLRVTRRVPHTKRMGEEPLSTPASDAG